MARFKTIPSITKYHHFKLPSSKPGVVELNEFVQSSTAEVNILKTDVSIDLQEMPEVIPPPGIPPERQKYLYKQERSFSHSMQTLPVLSLNRTLKLTSWRLVLSSLIAHYKVCETLLSLQTPSTY